MPSAGGAVSSDESDGSDALPKLTGSHSTPASARGCPLPIVISREADRQGTPIGVPPCSPRYLVGRVRRIESHLVVACKRAVSSVDPAGAKPRRDHRCLDRVSRHEVPTTPGKRTPGMISDPARASHLPVSQSVRHPDGVAGSLAMADPRVVGATPLDPRLWSEHPCRGASPPPSDHQSIKDAPLQGASWMSPLGL